ncbi:class I SAM-dependent methyltransferase [Actinomadura xylanilytica]|uniref:class I SAM-dependent methyltransferase n=1 Tax=Actinomadura xylanilytica TaxID=887459 RepID=UPI00255AF128|nr:methyltransferase domain-containing protein [Actinomadura xylanilytica]MDL4772679.1 methyltransferase domain-containing protein [Actinomadura xylanilytica]
MPQPATEIQESGGVVTPHLRRLLEFVEPARDDVCLDVARGPGPLPAALGPRVRHVTAVEAARAAASPGRGRTSTVMFGTGPVRISGSGDLVGTPAHSARLAHAGTARHRDIPHGAQIQADARRLPYRNGAFSLVTARFSLYRLGDPDRVLRELLRVCRPGGRLIIADLVQGTRAGPGRDRIERIRDPDHPGTPSITRLTELISGAGATVRRLDAFTVERPVEPWLAGAHDAGAADRIRAALTAEVDGGPRTGTKPRVIGGELWFTQSWAHIAAEPV